MLGGGFNLNAGKAYHGLEDSGNHENAGRTSAEEGTERERFGEKIMGEMALGDNARKKVTEKKGTLRKRCVAPFQCYFNSSFTAIQKNL